MILWGVILKVLKFLETNKSTYTAPFSKLQKEVEEAREEANDNVKLLILNIVPTFGSNGA